MGRLVILMSRSFAVLSTKGGTGKTTFALNLALALHNIGENSLLVDADIINPSVVFHLPEEHYVFTLNDVLSRRVSFSLAVNLHSSGLKLVPALPSINTFDLDASDVFLKYARAADFVIFDSHSHAVDFVEPAFDQFFIVTNAQLPALSSAYSLIKRFNHKLLAGVILNKVSKHDLSVEQVESFLGVPVVASFPYDDSFNKALSERVPFIKLFPNHKITKSFYELAFRISNRPFDPSVIK